MPPLPYLRQPPTKPTCFALHSLNLNGTGLTMFRRLVSLGLARPPQDDEPMPPASPDEGQHPEARGIAGLAGVLRGLTGSRKSPPPQHTLVNVSSRIPADVADEAATRNGLPPEHMEAFRQLKNGSLNERIAAAHTLRFAVADYPLAPVRPLAQDQDGLIRADHLPHRS
jgi:hypothetical protein